MILIAYRHGLRVSELISLRWEQVDLDQGLLHVSRLKNGINTTHPLFGPEIRALRKLKNASPYVFLSERKGPMTDSSFRKLLERVGRGANIPLKIHPHMLRQRALSWPMKVTIPAVSNIIWVTRISNTPSNTRR